MQQNLLFSTSGTEKTLKRQKTVSINLKIRNPNNELNDIRFEYEPSKDTTDGIADELLANGLVVDKDAQIISKSMQQLIENPAPNKRIKFRLSRRFGSEEFPDEANLYGFAELSLSN